MIVPICTAVMREVFSQAPPGEKEGALKVTLEVERAAAVDIVHRHVLRNPKAALRGEI